MISFTFWLIFIRQLVILNNVTSTPWIYMYCKHVFSFYCPHLKLVSKYVIIIIIMDITNVGVVNVTLGCQYL